MGRDILVSQRWTHVLCRCSVFSHQILNRVRTQPATAHAGHWSLAWTGLDAAEAAAALATAVLLTRSDPRASLTAAAGGAFLLTDAWFDVCTSAPGLDRCLAVAEAVFAELPLAAAAFWLAARLIRSAR